jgi:hypothetical protein
MAKGSAINRAAYRERGEWLKMFGVFRNKSQNRRSGHPALHLVELSGFLFWSGKPHGNDPSCPERYKIDCEKDDHACV